MGVLVLDVQAHMYLFYQVFLPFYHEWGKPLLINDIEYCFELIV